MPQDILPIQSTLNIQEQDGSPSVDNVQSIHFSNGSVTDNGDGSVNVDVGAGAGSVTSVALTAPAEFSVSGSPITTSGTIAITKATESANTVWAGPTTGSAAQPAFRALVAADIPTITSAKVSDFDTQVRTSRLDQMATPVNNTTNDVSTSAHGLAPILPNDATKYLDGTGAYTVPAGSGGSSVNMTQLHEHVYQEDHTAQTDGSTVNFVCANEFEPYTTEVYKSGLLLQPGVDYTEDTTADAVTLTAAPSASTPLIFAYIAA